MIIISAARQADAAAIAKLLEEMDRFYGATDFAPIEDRIAEINASIFTECSGVYVLLAQDAERVVGIASYSYLWPAVGLTKSLYLKELYVSETRRRHGIGTLLMHELIGIADETGCSRVEWTTDHDNADAQHFYKGLGFEKLSSKVFYRLDRPG